MQRLSDLHRDSGRLEEGAALLRDMAYNEPGNSVIAGLYLFGLNFLPKITATELLAEHIRFGRQTEARIPSLRNSRHSN